MAKQVLVTQKQKAAAALSVKRSATSGRYVSKATKAIAAAQPQTANAPTSTVR